MYLLLWVAVSLVGADRLAHARNRTPLPSSCSSSPRFATEPRTQLLHAADRHTAASAAVVVTTARDGCHALARPMNHAAARLTLPGGCVMTSFLLHIESPDRHYQTLTKPSTCTVRSRRHGHSKASARAIRAGLDITAQGGWRCTCLHMSDSVPALSPIRSYCLDASLAYRVLPLDRTSAASGYSTSRATSSRARWNSYATAKHSTPVPAAAFFYFTQGAWRFHPRCGASLLPLSQLTVAELLQPQFCYRLYAALSEPCTSPRAPSCFLCHSPLSRSYYNRSFATGYTPRSVGPAHHLYKFLSSSPRVCAPLLRHPRVP